MTSMLEYGLLSLCLFRLGLSGMLKQKNLQNNKRKSVFGKVI